MLQPKKPVKLSNQTEGQHKAALKSYELALHKYNLENNPNQLKGESTKNYEQRSKYDEFKIKQIEDKNPVKKWYNKMDASQEVDPNYFTRTTRKVLTSPVHVANYLDDVINLKDTQKFKSTKTKLKEGTKAAGSLIDVIGLASLPGLETGIKNTVGIQQQIIEQGVKQLFSQNIQDNAEKGIENTIDYFFNPSEQKEPMKKSMNPRKKYLNGSNSGGVTPNGIPSPASTLNDYQIMMAKAEEEAANNEWLPVVGLLGGLAQSAISFGAQGGFSKGTPTKTPAVAANGNNNVNQDVEVEGGEMYETPQGDTGEFQGPSHEQGGIPMEVGQDIPEGTKVYSDRLKVGKETLAERKETRERKIANLEKIAAQPLVDSAIKNATKRKMMAIQKEEAGDLAFQEQVNNMQQMADNVIAAFGTSMEGLQSNPVGDSMRYGMGTGADGVTEYAGGTGPDGLPSDFRFTNYDQYGNPILKPGTIGTAKFPKDIVGSADYDTDIIKNIQKGIGATPDGVWGSKSNTAMFNFDVTRGDEDAIAAKKKGYTKWSNTREDMVSGDYSTTMDALGLTEQGYKFNPQEPDMSGLVTPFVEPTGVLAGMEKTYQEGKAAELAGNPPGTMLSRGLEKGIGAAGKMDIPGVGDLTKYLGNYIGATAGIKTANEQRSTDVTHQNVFANAGKEAQGYLDKAMGNVDAMKQQAIMKATTATRGSKVSGRNGARGINQKRSVDWLYDQGLAENVASISANAANQVADIYKTKSSTSLSADQLKGTGQHQADMANEAAKDAYYTALGKGRSQQAEAIMQTGKDINDAKESKTKWNMQKKSGTYVQGNDDGTLSNKNIEFVDPKSGKKISISMAEYQKFISKSSKNK